MPLTDPHVRMVAEAVETLMDAPGDFEISAVEGCVGRLELVTQGGTRALVDLRTVVWGADGP